MYFKKTYGSVLPCDPPFMVWKGLLDTYDPPTVPSDNWMHWVTQLDLKTCQACRNQHGQIYSVEETPPLEPPLHPNCRCTIVMMEAVVAGNGTKDGNRGADWWMQTYGVLPEYYISERDLTALGWRRGKAPGKFAPGKMATMGIFYNSNGHLPQAPGRIWYEADLNYYSGKRNRHRLLWSNDGLLFVTYNHYETFIEVI